MCYTIQQKRYTLEEQFKTTMKDLNGREITKEEMDAYELELRNHHGWCDSREEFVHRIFQWVYAYGVEKARKMALNEISERRSMDAPDKPGYYRANND